MKLSVNETKVTGLWARNCAIEQVKKKKLKRSHEYLISKNSLAGVISFVFLNQRRNAFLELAPLRGSLLSGPSGQSHETHQSISHWGCSIPSWRQSFLNSFERGVTVASDDLSFKEPVADSGVKTRATDRKQSDFFQHFEKAVHFSHGISVS